MWTGVTVLAAICTLKVCHLDARILHGLAYVLASAGPEVMVYVCAQTVTRDAGHDESVHDGSTCCTLADFRSC